MRRHIPCNRVSSGRVIPFTAAGLEGSRQNAHGRCPGEPESLSAKRDCHARWVVWLGFSSCSHLNFALQSSDQILTSVKCFCQTADHALCGEPQIQMNRLSARYSPHPLAASHGTHAPCRPAPWQSPALPTSRRATCCVGQRHRCSLRHAALCPPTRYESSQPRPTRSASSLRAAKCCARCGSAPARHG